MSNIIDFRATHNFKYENYLLTGTGHRGYIPVANTDYSISQSYGCAIGFEYMKCGSYAIFFTDSKGRVNQFCINYEEYSNQYGKTWWYIGRNSKELLNKRYKNNQPTNDRR